jgi:hypothetical protein
MNPRIQIIEKNLGERSKALRRSRKAENSQDASFEAAEIFEALLIVSLGAQVGVVGNDELTKLSKRVFQPFFHYLATQGDLGADVPEFAARSEESTSLIRKFQRFQTTIELGIRGEVSSPEPVKLSQPMEFGKYADDCLLMWCSVVQDSGFRKYWRTIESASDREWEQIIKTPIHTASVVGAIDDTSDVANCVYYGFLRLINYCAQLQEIATAMSKDRNIDRSDAALFTDRIRETFSWRVVAPGYRSNRRVEEIRSRWVRLIRIEEPNKNVSREFEQILEQAFGLWFAMAEY